jgi:prevent-host-death family protein
VELARRIMTMYSGHMEKVAAAKFKATCLELIDRVAKTGEPLTVTKRGKPMVKLVSVRADEGNPRKRSVIACMKETILYLAPEEELFSPSRGARWNAQG